MIKILLYNDMRYLKLYENFDWSDEDFDYEDESPVEIIGNQYFTDFLVERDLYDKFVESVKKCNHEKVLLSSIKDINYLIRNRNGLYQVIDNLIHWGCAFNLTKVDWEPINRDWNSLCYNKRY